MAKLTAWLVTIIGILLLLPLIGVSQLATYNDWLIAIGVLVIGVTKIIRKYSKKR